MFNWFKNKEYQSKFTEFDTALQPLSAEQSKARFIISEIYAQHGIDAGKCLIYDYCLDSEVFTDLCVFNDNELASLRKWTQRYKDLETEIIKLGEKCYIRKELNYQKNKDLDVRTV